MVLPTTWPLLAFCFLVASAAVAQPQLPARQRQDRRTALPTTPGEPIPEVYVAAGNLTTLAFNSPLDRDSLVMDRTRFKWVDVGDRILSLQPLADLRPGERLVVKIGFKDHALPTQAVLAVLTDSKVMDGNVEVDRRANAPEALLSALAQKEAELAELKAQCTEGGFVGMVLSGWLTGERRPLILTTEPAKVEGDGLLLEQKLGFQGEFPPVLAIRIQNLPGQSPWEPGEVRLSALGGAALKVLSVRMKPEHLGSGEEGWLVVEAKTPPWADGKTFSVDMVDASGQRHLSFNLFAQ